MAGDSNKKCKYCGNIFYKRSNQCQSHFERMTYCSKKCQHKSMVGSTRKKSSLEKQSETLRKMSKFYKKSKELYEYLYIKNRLSLKQIAHKFGLNDASLYCHFKRIGIQTRPQKTSMKNGSESVNWRGGVYLADGYLRLSSGKMVHRILAERVLRRRLKENEVVHHIDGDRANNKNNNLLITTKSYHMWLHRMIDLKNNKQLFGEAY